MSAALAVIRAEGLEALSMRRLSRELGRSAMAAYWYVSDKQELLDLVARKLLAEVRIPPSDSGPWDERLRKVLDSINDRLRQHPGVAGILLERMTSTDLNLMNGVLGILVDAGFKGRYVFLSYAMIHTYLFGRYQVQVLGPREVSGLPEGIDEPVASLIPHLRKLRGRDFFNYGVETLIAGLKVQLETLEQE